MQISWACNLVARWPLLWTVPALGEILGFWDSGTLGFWDSKILGLWDSGRCSPSAPLDAAPGRSFLALLAVVVPIGDGLAISCDAPFHWKRMM